MTSIPIPAAGAPPVAFAVARWLLRITVTLTSLAVLAQPVSIGQYLQGRFSMLAVHSAVGTAVIIASFFAGCAAIFYSLVGGRVWVAIAVPVLGFLIELQVGMGYSHQLGIHVPLGVAIVATAIVLGVWVWSPASRRFRPRRSRMPAPPQAEQVVR